MPRNIIEFIVDYYRHLRMISRNAALFLLGSFFINMLFSVFYLIFNLYLRELGFSESVIGRTNTPQDKPLLTRDRMHLPQACNTQAIASDHRDI